MNQITKNVAMAGPAFLGDHRWLKAADRDKCGCQHAP
jgi:hypothetical protein